MCVRCVCAWRVGGNEPLFVIARAEQPRSLVLRISAMQPAESGALTARPCRATSPLPGEEGHFNPISENTKSVRVVLCGAARRDCTFDAMAALTQALEVRVVLQSWPLCSIRCLKLRAPTTSRSQVSARLIRPAAAPSRRQGETRHMERRSRGLRD